MTFRRAEEVERVFCSEGDGEGPGFGKADVFAGHPNHAAREIERVFARFEHARKPIEGSVGVGVADGFVQRRDEIEVFLAGLVEAEKFSLQDIFEEFGSDDPRAFFISMSAAHGKLESVVRSAGVAIGEGGYAK